jgi:hypothetical protein
VRSAAKNRLKEVKLQLQKKIEGMECHYMFLTDESILNLHQAFIKRYRACSHVEIRSYKYFLKGIEARKLSTTLLSSYQPLHLTVCDSLQRRGSPLIFLLKPLLEANKLIELRLIDSSTTALLWNRLKHDFRSATKLTSVLFKVEGNDSTQALLQMLDSVSKAPYLDSLNLQMNRSPLTILDENFSFQRFKNLTYLQLYCSVFENLNDIPSLALHPTLESLSIAGSGVESLISEESLIELFDNILHIQKLTSLYLGSVNVSALEPTILRDFLCSERCKLREFSINHANVRREYDYLPALISILQQNQTLSYFKLSHTGTMLCRTYEPEELVVQFCHALALNKTIRIFELPPSTLQGVSNYGRVGRYQDWVISELNKALQFHGNMNLVVCSILPFGTPVPAIRLNAENEDNRKRTLSQLLSEKFGNSLFN